MMNAMKDRGRTFGSSILLLGNYRPTLVIAEILQRRGYRVICGLEGCDQGAEYSRFVDELWDHPPVNNNTTAFVLELCKLLENRPEIEFVLPVTEKAVRLFAEESPALPERVTVIMNDPAIVNMCLSKTKMMQLAQSCGVPVAPFKTAADLTGLNAAIQVLGYPVVVRPKNADLRLFDKKAITLENAECLQNWFATWPAEQTELLIQAKAPGIRHNVYFAAKEGKLAKYLHSRIDRTDRPDGSGLAVDGLTISPDPVIQTYTAKLIASMAYTGIGCAQYLVDESTGQISFLEINSRFAGNHAVPEHCGLELTDFMMKLAMGENIENPKLTYGKSGIRYSWLVGDLEGLKAAIRKREVGLRDTLKWFVRCADCALKTDLDMMFNRQDMKPGLTSLLKVLPGVRHILNPRPKARRENLNLPVLGSKSKINILKSN